MLELPKSEKSYWRESYTKGLYPKLSADTTVDVVVIGAGITGLTSAYLLSQSGLTVAVLDKDTVGGGTSGRTTGKVTSQHNLIYDTLNNRNGETTARLYGEANQAAVNMVDDIVTSEKIDCEWSREDNYVFSDQISEVETLKKEASTAKRLGLPASFVTKLPLPFKIEGAVKFSNQARINSQKYLLGLAKAIEKSGGHIYEHSSVSWIRDGSPANVKSNGHTVTASHIIVATNVPTSPLMARGGYCILEYPKESYIVAGTIKDKVEGMYISPDKHNYSILPVGNSTILVGGEGHISGLRGSRKDRFQKLANYAETHLGVTEITHKWSDRDYLSYDDIPLVGKLYPWSKNVYVGTGFMKWGLSNGTVAAMIIHDTIMHKPNDWAAVFDSNRSGPIKSIPRVFAKYVSGKG